MVRLCSPSRALSVFLLIFALASGARLIAQNLDSPHLEPKPPDLQSRSKPLQVNVNLVLVPVTVTDQQNRPVLGLTKSDFAVYEDSVEQSIRYFSADDEPISLGVLLDVSGSMKNKIEVARQAVVEFFRSSHPDDDYFVITFSDDPLLLADSTRSIGYIQDRMTQAKPAGHTALLDAIYLGLSKMRRARYKRRALLVISDGGDNHSRYTAGEVARLIEEADVQIYAIGIFDSIFRTPEEWGGKRLLTRLTESSGGRVLTIRNAAQLPEAADAISLELRNQYVLGYEPDRVSSKRPPSKPANLETSKPSGGWHKLRVRLTHPPQKKSPADRMHVYARSGYFSPEN
jgi:Ca-activated chloride channel family protein